MFVAKSANKTNETNETNETKEMIQLVPLLLVFLTGIPGIGKSTMVKYLRDKGLPPNVYYLSKDELTIRTKDVRRTFKDMCQNPDCEVIIFDMNINLDWLQNKLIPDIAQSNRVLTRVLLLTPPLDMSWSELQAVAMINAFYRLPNDQITDPALQSTLKKKNVVQALTGSYWGNEETFRAISPEVIARVCPGVDVTMVPYLVGHLRIPTPSLSSLVRVGAEGVRTLNPEITTGDIEYATAEEYLACCEQIFEIIEIINA